MTIAPPAHESNVVRPLGVGRPFHWTLHAECPPRWWAWLERCGGGFFHTPAAFVAADGETFFAELSTPEGVTGIAAGQWRRCRLSRRPRHVYLPTAPAVIGTAGRQHALEMLIDRLRDGGAAEVVMDSFDAAWIPEIGGSSERFASRMEYLIELDEPPEQVTARFVHHHRRHLRRGEREQWRFGAVPAVDVPDVIEAVQHHAARRAADRGVPFDVERVEAPRGRLGAPWGSAAFAAWRDAELLAAVLIGWGGRRAFYLQGGSTPAGYAVDASTWLQWRVMRELTDQGIAVYSLGGAPGTAASLNDPSHGLHRFKTGFGASVSTCQGLCWTLRPAHTRAHALWRMVRRA